LLQVLTAARVFSASITFPDAAKNQLYTWQYTTTRAPGDNYHIGVACRTAVGARPQEWTQTVDLGAAPKGADLFIGRISLVRTASPSHTWLGQTISPFPVLADGVQIAGSMMVEQVMGFSRALTIDIAGSDEVIETTGGRLVAILEHSVGPAAGNFGQQGNVPVAVSNTSIPPNHTRSGVENVSASGVAALPVFWRDESPYNKSEATTGSGLFGPGEVAGFGNARRYGGAAAAAYDDPTNYSSTYALTVRGRFGRRS
jgi:hypothetical protein